MDDRDDPSPGQTEEQAEDWLPEDHSDGRARFPTESINETPPLAIPQRAEPTLKERLVERERQARVETERARLKRQFALSMNGGVEEDEENGSVNGTLGEGSSVAAAPSAEQDDLNEDATKELGYAMERFLQQRNDVDENDEKPKAEPGVLMERFLAEPVVVEQHQQHDGAARAAEEIMQEDLKIAAEEDTLQKVLHTSSEVEENTGQPLPPLLDSTNAVASRDESELQATVGSVRSYSTVTNASLAPVSIMDVYAPPESPGALPRTVGENSTGDTDVLRERDAEDQFTSVHSTQGSVSDEPRVFRLTEAEIQEMAAIEEASIGNAPPSEREETFSESSLVGELVGDLLGDLPSPRGLERVGDFSERTNTTALESASITSADGDLSERLSALEMDRHSVDVIERDSVSSHLVVSPGASDDGSVSITACPPSVTAEDEVEPLMLVGPDEDVSALPHNDRERSAILEMISFENGPPLRDANIASLNCAPSFQDEGGPLDIEASAAANVGVINRQSRPGMKAAPARLPPQHPITPNAGKETQKDHMMLDDFDFDKNKFDPLVNTPNSAAMNSFDDLPGDDTWSPRAEMNLSPLRPDRTSIPSDRVAAALQYPNLNLLTPRLENPSSDEERGMAITYGSTAFHGEGIHQPTFAPPDHVSFDVHSNTDNFGNEAQPLIDRQNDENHTPLPPLLKHMISNVFRSMRSESDTDSFEAVNTDSEKYLSFGILARAFPERFFALLVTLVVEIPVLLMISGGSDRLCMLIGRRRYQLMMGFLPLSSAISGNCGLQASTVTTRAISHDHVTRRSYLLWLGKEVAAGACLGCGMGCVLGTYAYFASGMDYAFALTIFVANFVSVMTAGFTGTLAPLIFTFIFRRDSALYGGPLETAVQDIVGSFAMVVLSYHLLLFFGPMEISPDDICGSDSSDR